MQIEGVEPEVAWYSKPTLYVCIIKCFFSITRDDTGFIFVIFLAKISDFLQKEPVISNKGNLLDGSHPTGIKKIEKFSDALCYDITFKI
jgi:hypothetical protein